MALYAADLLLVDFEFAEDALAHARKFEFAVETDPYWKDGRHEGDCTKQPHTCARCLMEEFEAKARALAESEELSFG